MIEVHAETRVVKFPTLARAIHYLEDAKRQVRKANDVLGKVYIVDTKAAESYTAKHPNRLKGPVFVRRPDTYECEVQVWTRKSELEALVARVAQEEVGKIMNVIGIRGMVFA